MGLYLFLALIALNKIDESSLVYLHLELAVGKVVETETEPVFRGAAFINMFCMDSGTYNHIKSYIAILRLELEY